MIKEPVSNFVSLPGLRAALSFEGLSPKLAHTTLLAGGPAPLQPSAFFLLGSLTPALGIPITLSCFPKLLSHSASLHRVPAPLPFIPSHLAKD